MRVKATLTILVEYKINQKYYHCSDAEIAEMEGYRLEDDPSYLFKIPGVRFETKLEQIEA